jgi:hypothetical protein
MIRYNLNNQSPLLIKLAMKYGLLKIYELSPEAFKKEILIE